jgi:signal transduction histidine kinase
VDPLELRQVIVNMVLNACQACEAREREGVVRIGIALGQENADNRMVEITVRDTGRGIAAPDVERVFEPFFTTRSDGMGLGLSFCRDVLRRCGGDIAVVETTNTGTTIVVRLPLWSEHDTRSGR